MLIDVPDTFNIESIIKKLERDSQESLEALRKLSALMLKAALNQEFKGIRLGEAVAD